MNLTQSQTKPTSDDLLKEIAEVYIDNIGWSEAMDILPIFENSEGKTNNGRYFGAMEWIGVHFVTLLREKVEEEALKEGKCPNDGTELETRFTPNSYEYPGDWSCKCPKCHDEFSLSQVGVKD